MAAQDFLAGDWLVQPSRDAVSLGGTSRHLEPKVMEVLVRLAERPGNVLSKEELIGAVWPDVFVTDNVLMTAVWRLRQALGADAIQTVPRRGYRLTLPVRPARPTVRSIAVLPLANLSGDPAQEYFADGITEALISALSHISALRVISRTSVMPYKSTRAPLPQVGAELGVDAVVEGSVIRQDDQVRVAVQLLHAASDRHLWARTFDVHLRDTLNLQDEVARSVAAELGICLSPEEQARLVRPRPVNPVAHDLYLRGRYQQYRGTQEGARSAVACMREAIAVDPEYALAHVGLAHAMVFLSSGMVGGMRPVDAYEVARPATARALALDPELPEALAVNGYIQAYGDWDWAGAEATTHRAIGISPSLALAKTGLAWLNTALNREADAISAFRSVCGLDPLNMVTRASLGLVLTAFERYDEAIESLRDAIRLEPRYHYTYLMLGTALGLTGRIDEAVAAIETAEALCADPTAMGFLGGVYAVSGRTNDARRVRDELEQLARVRYVNQMTLAITPTLLGEADRALDHLEAAADNRESDVVFVRTFPSWRSLRGQPRFEALVQRMGFPG